MKKIRDYVIVDDAERERVLTIAAKLFRSQGYEKTTVRQIAEACKMLPGSLHYRYKSKDSILVDMMRLAIDQTLRQLKLSVAGISDPMESLRMAVQAYLEILVSENDMVYVLLFEWRALEGDALGEMIEERDRFEQYWKKHLSVLKRQGYIKNGIDVNLIRLIGFGAVNWVATWYRHGGRYDLKGIADTIWITLTAGFINPSLLNNPQIK